MKSEFRVPLFGFGCVSVSQQPLKLHDQLLDSLSIASGFSGSDLGCIVSLQTLMRRTLESAEQLVDLFGCFDRCVGSVSSFEPQHRGDQPSVRVGREMFAE